METLKAALKIAVRGKQFVKTNGSAISFKIQAGPVKDVGVNGCQIDTLIATAASIIEFLDYAFPHPKNKECIELLDKALECLEERKKEQGTSAE